jgi:hypothetical protein
VIHAYENLGLIEELDWIKFANQFDKSGFEVYITRALADIDDSYVDSLSHDLQAKLVTSETLDQIRIRFFKLSKYSRLYTTRLLIPPPIRHIMQFGKSIGIACSSFAITNIDDIFVLVTFFSEASTSKTMTPLRITLGQYIGFTVLSSLA